MAVTPSPPRNPSFPRALLPLCDVNHATGRTAGARHQLPGHGRRTPAAQSFLPPARMVRSCDPSPPRSGALTSQHRQHPTSSTDSSIDTGRRICSWPVTDGASHYARRRIPGRPAMHPNDPGSLVAMAGLGYSTRRSTTVSCPRLIFVSDPGVWYPRRLPPLIVQ
jgi:hypothetical protein